MAHDEAIQAAKSVMSAHIDALNARDEDDLAATLHFPHIRLSQTDLRVWDTPESYFADFRARAGSRWARSSFDDMRVAQTSDTKVHIETTVRRFDGADTEIGSFRSLWVITRENGRWAAKLRSSFAET